MNLEKTYIRDIKTWEK